jgi:hypothetical protein
VLWHEQRVAVGISMSSPIASNKQNDARWTVDKPNVSSK